MSKYELKQPIPYLDNVSVGYDGKEVLKNITMTEKDVVREGAEVTGQTIDIVGRSGRGKSTLFKVLTGLLKPTQGTVISKYDLKEIDLAWSKFGSEHLDLVHKIKCDLLKS